MNQPNQNFMNQNYNTGHYNNNQSNMIPQYYNNTIINQYTAYQYNNSMVNPQSTTVGSQYPMNVMNTQFQNPMRNSAAANSQMNYNNQFNINNSQLMQNNFTSLSAINMRLSNYSGNTSIIRVLQCLYSIFSEENKISETQFRINNAKQYSNISVPFSSKLFYTLSIIGKNFPDSNNDPQFLNSIQEFRNQASLIEDRYKGIDELEPKMIFCDLFIHTNKEFVNKSNGIDQDIFYQNLLFKDLKDDLLKKLPKSSYPKIYEKIEKFKNNYTSPFVDNFYFILLELTKCNNCQNIIDVKSIFSFFLILKGEINGANVSNLIDDYIRSPSNNGLPYCNQCKGMMKKEYSFLNTPKYLLIDFEGRKLPKYLDNEIDISKYSTSILGPKKYSLYAYITIDNNQKYIEYIKYKNVWYKYSEGNNVDPISNPNNTIFCCPYIAIYKGK